MTRGFGREEGAVVGGTLRGLVKAPAVLAALEEGAAVEAPVGLGKGRWLLGKTRHKHRSELSTHPGFE